MSNPENEATFIKLEAEANALEAEANAKEDAVKKKWDPKESLADVKVIHTLVDPVLGEVKYGKLSKKEFDSVKNTADASERATKRVVMMLQKGYPGLTEADVEAMPSDEFIRISNALAEKMTGFLSPKPLQTMKTLNSGLNQTQTPTQKPT